MDQEEGIEGVNIHYTWTPLGVPPDWERHRETRPMPLNSNILEGLGAPTAGFGDPTRIFREQSRYFRPANVRSKVLKLPRAVLDPETDGWVHAYHLHHYFEVFQKGRRFSTKLFTEPIASKELVYEDRHGRCMAVCAYYSVYDWDCPVYISAEDPRFIEIYGEDDEFRSHKLYHYADKERFYREKYNMMRAIPLPWRWVCCIHAPKGALVHQMWHIGNLALPPGEAFEEWVDYTVHIL